MTSPIWVLIDHAGGQITSVSKEMLQDAAEAAQTGRLKVWAILVNGCEEQTPWCAQVGEYGADRLVRAEAGGAPFLTAEAFTLILDRIAALEGRPLFTVVANHFLGQEIGARLAARWKIGFANDCVSFSVDTGGPEAVRVTYGEQLETIVSFPEGAAVLSFRTGSAGLGAPVPGRIAEENICQIDLASGGLKQVVRRVIPADQRTVDIAEADFIIAGGQGLGSSENFRVLQELADRLGAAVAGTRLADDKGWIGVDRRVGLTGKTVAPKLYMAVGISGAREHIVGMDTSKAIIAVNTEPRAEIFGLAHLGVVGDAAEVMKAMLKKLPGKKPE